MTAQGIRHTLQIDRAPQHATRRYQIEATDVPAYFAVRFLRRPLLGPNRRTSALAISGGVESGTSSEDSCGRSMGFEVQRAVPRSVRANSGHYGLCKRIGGLCRFLKRPPDDLTEADSGNALTTVNGAVPGKSVLHQPG